MSQTVDLTINQLTARLNSAGIQCTQPEVNGFIVVMKKLGVVTEAGKQKSISGKGKPSYLYRIPLNLTFTLDFTPVTVSVGTQTTQTDETVVAEESNEVTIKDVLS